MQNDINDIIADIIIEVVNVHVMTQYDGLKNMILFSESEILHSHQRMIWSHCDYTVQRN